MIIDDETISFRAPKCHLQTCLNRHETLSLLFRQGTLLRLPPPLLPDWEVLVFLENAASLCARSLWSNPHFQEQPQMSRLIREPAGECALVPVGFPFDCCLAKTTESSPLALLSPCLSAFPSVLHTQALLLALKIKGTSKCLGSLDMLSRHQTLWSVWGCFCQGQ